MNDHNADHWKELTDDLGVAADEKPDVEKPLGQDQATPTAGEPAAMKPSKAARPAKKPRCASDWGGLANQLGLPTPEPVEADVIPEAFDALADAEATLPPASSPEVDEPAGGPRATHEQQPTPADWAESVPLDLGEPDEIRAETVTEEFFEEVFEAQMEAEAEADDAESGRAVREAEFDEEEPAPRRRRGRRRRRPDRSRTGEPSAEEATSSEDEDDDAAAEIGQLAEEGEDGEAETRSRRRRRRRRRPSKREEAESELGEEDEQETDELEDTRRRRGRRSRAKTDAEISEDREDLDSDDVEAPARKHRKIPTWDEAIDLIVGGNLESRSKSPGGKGGSRRRGRRRGN